MKCRKCKVEKTLDCFYKKYTLNLCKECSIKESSVYNKANKEKRKAYMAKYNAKHKVSLKEYQKAYWENNKESLGDKRTKRYGADKKDYFKEYWLKNKDDLAKIRKAKAENNTDKE